MFQENTFRSPKRSLLYEVLPVYHYQCSWKKICLDHGYSQEREIARWEKELSIRSLIILNSNVCVCLSVCLCGVLPAKSCPIICQPMGCSPPGCSVCGILQARILEWVAISFSRGASPARDRTSSGGFFTTAPPGKSGFK